MKEDLHVLVDCKHIGDLENELSAKENLIKDSKGEWKTL